MFRLYLDEDVRRDLLLALRDRGIDVISAAEAQRRSKSDLDQLLFATSDHRTLVTRNVRDFAILHRQTIEAGETHAGIIAITRQRFAPGEYADALVRLGEQLGPEELTNRMEYLGLWL